MIDFTTTQLARAKDVEIQRQAELYATQRWQHMPSPFSWRAIAAQLILALIIAIAATLVVAEVAAASRPVETRYVPWERSHVVVVASIK
jgi:ABC-type lipoprotein release transport system permease subunit